MTNMNNQQRAAPSADNSDLEIAVNARLDGLHSAASLALFEEYFSAFAPDGVFMGTDPNERWNIEQFKTYTKPHFDKGQGWTYSLIERHIHVFADKSHASFDELLRNDSFGVCRGSGVLILNDGKWMIEHYHLAVTIPNDCASDIVRLIRSKA